MKPTKTYVFYGKSLVLYTSLLLLIVLMVSGAKESVEAVKNSLILCYKTIIPSLFPFFVLSGLLLNTGFVAVLGNLLSPIMHPMFGVSGKGALAFVIGIISGYPMGAVTVGQLYERGFISKKEGEKLLPFCNNSGPLFIIGAVGIGMFQSLEIGIFLYMVHFVAAVMVGIIFRFYGTESNSRISRSSHKKMMRKIRDELYLYKQSETRSFGQIFSDCIQNAVQTTLNICGFVALFSSLLESVKPILDTALPNPLLNLMGKGALEITAGIFRVTNQPYPITAKIILVSLLIGFGGICVYLQVLGAVSHTKMSTKAYLAGKTLHGILAAGLSYIGLFYLPFAIPTFQAVENEMVFPYDFAFFLLFLGAVCFVLYNSFRRCLNRN